MMAGYTSVCEQQQLQPTDSTDAAFINSAAAAADAASSVAASGAPIGPSVQQRPNYHHQKNSSKQFRGGGTGSNGSSGFGYRHPTPGIGPLAKEFKVCEVCNARCTDSAMYQSHLSGAKHLKKEREISFKEKSEAKDPSVYCDICHLTLHPQLMAIHRDGKRHRKAAGAANISKDAASSGAGPQQPAKSRNKALKVTENSAEPAATAVSVSAAPPDGDQPATGSEQPAHSGADAIEQQQYSKMSKEELLKVIAKRYHMECTVCRVNFTGFQLAETHFNSRAHRKAFQQFQSDQIRSKGYVCQVCDLPLNSKELLDAHVKGYKHALRKNGNYIPQGHPFYGKYQRYLETRMTYRRPDAV